MKAIAAVLFLGTLGGFAPPVTADERQTGSIHYEFDLASGRRLSLDMRSAEVAIEGSESQKFTIRFEGEKADRANEVKVTYKDKGDSVECGIKDGRANNLRILIAP